MKNLVLFKSKYGSTKQYADFISKALNCPMDDFSNLNNYDLENFDSIIVGEGVYAGKLKTPKVLKEIIRKYPNKNYIFYLVGLANMDDEENTNRLYADIKKYLGDDIKKIKVFFLRGSIDYSKLSVKHSFMMWLLYQSLKHKPEDKLPKDGREVINTYGKKVDFIDEATIKPIVDYLNDKEG